MTKVYLAGGWSDWREKFTSELTAEWLNPVLYTNEKDWFKLETNAISDCDCMIAFFGDNNPSGFGMTFEMGMAFALKKPYILVVGLTCYSFSMQRAGAEFHCSTIQEAIEYIKQSNWMNIK